MFMYIMKYSVYLKVQKEVLLLKNHVKNLRKDLAEQKHYALYRMYDLEEDNRTLSRSVIVLEVQTKMDTFNIPFSTSPR